MASTYLHRTFTTPTNNKKWTYSLWVKKSAVTGNQAILSCGADGNNRGTIYLADNGKLFYYETTSGTDTTEIGTNRLFRDPNAWYHIVFRIDTTHGTEANRVRIYINGVQETSFAVSNYPSLNATDYINSGIRHDISGRNHAGSSDLYFNGSMSHVHFLDGEDRDASYFGETDSTTGEWKIKTSPTGINYGTNGFFILKDGNSVTDQSGNSNNFTVGGGTLTKTEDNPSNVFATWNPLDGVISLGNSTFTYGNTRWNSETGSNKCWTRSTLGMTSGKYYFEFKVETPSNNCAIGISDRPAPNLTTELGSGAYDYSYQSANSGNKYNNNSQSSYGNTYTTNDIVSCALDLDNLKVYFGKNGVWQNSGDPTSGSTGTGAAFTIASPSSTNGGAYFFCGADLTGANNTRQQANFGNGYFGTTAVSSAGTNASGNGIFEYDVPTGYTALSTKGLNL